MTFKRKELASDGMIRDYSTSATNPLVLELPEPEGNGVKLIKFLDYVTCVYSWCVMMVCNLLLNVIDLAIPTQKTSDQVAIRCHF